MANFNKVILLGNLTRDPELRYTPRGTPIASFGLAVNRSWKDESGQLISDVLFIDVDAFGSPADLISRSLKKGNPLFVEGRLKLNTCDDKQTGQRRNRISVVLENFQFIGQRQDYPQQDHVIPSSYGVPPQGQPTYPNQQTPQGMGAYAPQPPSPTMPPNYGIHPNQSIPPGVPDADPNQEDDVPF